MQKSFFVHERNGCRNLIKITPNSALGKPFILNEVDLIDVAFQVAHVCILQNHHKPSSVPKAIKLLLSKLYNNLPDLETKQNTAKCSDDI